MTRYRIFSAKRRSIAVYFAILVPRRNDACSLKRISYPWRTLGYYNASPGTALLSMGVSMRVEAQLLLGEN